ncbi:MAG: SDR family NAD(P)-dependent oxidoreductase [Acidimicrobiia bacterium]
MTRRFDGKVALVTGGAGGVGAASARHLAGEGAHVIVADIADEAARAVADEIGGEHTALDVGDPKAWSALVTRAAEDRGIDLAHLNAGILAAAAPEPFLDTSVERLHQMERVNLDGVVLGIHALAPLMLARGGGSIVATASVAGLLPYAGDPMYAATKHGIVGLVRSVAPQLGRDGVRIHAICPGGIDTAMVSERQKDAMSMAGRPVLDPAEVAAAVADLLARDRGGAVQTIVQGQGVEDVETPRTLGSG